MKISVILYHSGVSIYKKDWIYKCVNSMINQTYKKFVFYELNYGDDDYSILKDISYNGDFLFFNQKLKNHADAMNYLFDVSVKNDIDIYSIQTLMISMMLIEFIYK